MPDTIGIEPDDYDAAHSSTTRACPTLYDLWLAHADELRAEVDDRAVDNMLAEAREGRERNWAELPPPMVLIASREK